MKVRWVVGAHPDDEMAALSLVLGEPDVYPVFVLCTYGEATSLCGGGGLQADLGERVPLPQPFAGTGTPLCGAQRVDAWHAFLDEAVGPAAPVGLVGGLPLWVGPACARVVGNGGDGRLVVESVLATVAAARALLPRLPVQEEQDVVAATYYNADQPGSWHYVHPDHRAVHVALWGTDLGLPGGQWGRTAAGDPDVSRTATIEPSAYDALMGVAADGTRTGSFQRAYGWLAPAVAAPPFTAGGAWIAGETDAETPASRVQSFWHRFGSAP